MELAEHDSAYEDVASKFWEHFLYIAHAMNHLGNDGLSLWNEEDGFFYDVLHLPDGERRPLKVRSMVGLIPLFAVETLEPELLDRLPGFKRRLEWFIDNRQDLTRNVACMRTEGRAERRLLSIVSADQLRRCCASCSTSTSFSRRTASARCHALTRTSRTCCTSTASNIASTTSRPSRPRDSSAATRTGAVRSGSR